MSRVARWLAWAVAGFMALIAVVGAATGNFDGAASGLFLAAFAAGIALVLR